MTHPVVHRPVVQTLSALLAASFAAGCALTPDAEAIRHEEKRQPYVPEEVRGLQPASREYVLLCERRIRTRFTERVEEPLILQKRLRDQDLSRQIRVAQRKGLPKDLKALGALLAQPVRTHLAIHENGRLEMVGFDSTHSSTDPEIAFLNDVFKSVELPPMPPEVAKETGGQVNFGFWVSIEMDEE